MLLYANVELKIHNCFCFPFSKIACQGFWRRRRRNTVILLRRVCDAALSGKQKNRDACQVMSFFNFHRIHHFFPSAFIKMLPCLSLLSCLPLFSNHNPKLICLIPPYTIQPKILYQTNVTLEPGKFWLRRRSPHSSPQYIKLVPSPV